MAGTHARASSNGAASSSGSNLSATKEKVVEEKMTDSPGDREVIEKIHSKDSSTKVEVKDKEDDVFAHLPAHEAEILKRQVFVPEVTVGFKTLYRYSTRWDLIIVAISALCSIIGGAVLPLMTVGDHPEPYLQSKC